MNIITPQHAKYDEIVIIDSPKHYVIDCTKMAVDEEVICPFDNDMKVSKNESGQIILKKKSYFHPFSSKPQV